MGSDPGQDPTAYPDELPPHEITLPRYYIGRYPVTGRQFRAFIDQTGHKPENEPVSMGRQIIRWCGSAGSMR